MEDYKIKSIKVDVRRSYNYNSYSCEISVDILDDCNTDKALQYLWARANTECETQIQEQKKQEDLIKQKTMQNNSQKTQTKKFDIKL